LREEDEVVDEGQLKLERRRKRKRREDLILD
jgi:hypothetical protein